jgi:hypothetical protein
MEVSDLLMDNKMSSSAGEKIIGDHGRGPSLSLLSLTRSTPDISSFLEKKNIHVDTDIATAVLSPQT